MNDPQPVQAGAELPHPKDFYRADMSEREIEALARSMCDFPDIRAPVQRYAGGIPWEMHMRAYEAYAKKWSPQVALIDLYGRGCRGGFGTGELDDFLPGWRDQLSERTKLLDHIANAADELTRLREKVGRMEAGLGAAIRAAELALFVIRKQGVMPNSSWESGFNSDLASARQALADQPK